jgi:hypothetical protein
MLIKKNVSGSGAAIRIVVVAILGASVQNFRQMGGSINVLRPFILSSVSGLMRFRDGCDKERASNLGKGVTETTAKI